MARTVSLVLVAFLAAVPAGAQRLEPLLHQVQSGDPLARSVPAVPTPGTGPLRSVIAKVPLWSAPIASAIVPGAGQAMLGQQRFVVYLAVEGFVWLQYLKDQNDWRQQRAAYRNLAAQVARAPFTTNPPVGVWAYYEAMEHYLESGVYSVTGSMTNVQPEPDESTYNGAMWLLARRNYWPNPSVPPPVNSPEYQRALQFYESRAVRPQYRWSWRNAQLEQDLYRRTISKANDAVRRATSDLGIMLANHVLSSVDAFATLQLRISAAPNGDTEFGWRVMLPLR